MRGRWLVWLAILGVGLMGCGEARQDAPATAASTAGDAVLPTVATLPTLYPTATRPLGGARPTAVPATITPSPTPIDFSQPVISFRYEIPALGLDRRLEGTADSQIRLVDGVTGAEVMLVNQARALIDMQTVLPDLPLAELPEGCERCVRLTLDLPLAGRAETGWLQDDIVLASIEDFFVRQLGPHFPPDTAVGLHRRASGYNVGHTVAILTDGSLWRWQATDAEVPARLSAGEAAVGDIIAEAEGLPLNRLEPSYRADCPFFSEETLYFAASNQMYKLACPSLSLPTTLVSFYADLDAVAQAGLDLERNLALPGQVLPLTAVVFYQRSDGATLTIYNDGERVGVDATGRVYTATAKLEAEEVAALQTALTTSGVIPRTVEIVTDEALAAETESLLLVRGELGVYEFGWAETIGQSLVPAIITLDELLVEQVGFLGETAVPSAPISQTETISP